VVLERLTKEPVSMITGDDGDLGIAATANWENREKKACLGEASCMKSWVQIRDYKELVLSIKGFLPNFS
jgi:hypothetical protein